MYQNTKSATTAGLLGIFLGSFGAHNWYLGEKSKGIAHVCMMGGGVLVEIIAGLVLPNVLSYSSLFTWASILAVLGGVATLAMSASAIWGLVEGITILAQGDAGLARKGYAVATPQGYAPQGQYGYGPQPMQPQQPYYGPQPMQGQPMPGYGQPADPYMNQQMGQPMNQPMPNQPMQAEQPMPNGDENNMGGFNGRQ